MADDENDYEENWEGEETEDDSPSPPSIHCICESTWLAVRELALGQGTVPDRLRNAWTPHLYGLRASELPDELRAVYKKLEAFFSREGSQRSAIADSSDDDRLGAARSICNLYTTSLSLYDAKRGL